MSESKIIQKPKLIKGRSVRQHPIFLRLFSPWGTALCYLVAITLAESITTMVEPQIGLIFHGLIFLALILHASLENQILFREFLLTLVLIPLIRILNLAMPLQLFPQIYWYMIIGIPLFIAAFYTAHVVHVNRKIFGMNWRKLPMQLLIAMPGVGCGYIEYLILRPAPLVHQLRLEQILLPALILLIFTGFLEEFIFRGLLQYISGRRLGRYGMVYTAILFTVLHIGYKSWADLIFVFIVALYFGWEVQNSDSILGVSLAHGLINISLFLIFPFIQITM